LFVSILSLTEALYKLLNIHSVIGTIVYHCNDLLHTADGWPAADGKFVLPFKLFHVRIKTFLFVPYSSILSLGGPFRFAGQHHGGESKARSLNLNAMSARPKEKKKAKLIDASNNLQA
jgi:hypothetical protein